ncbi:putative feruloyl esterase [Lachnellula hyalina]|uniref:Carboxylic ester hydrolase n=1 Tax=Lachnellula hyalina TaxID=1316788 RepID=A0A8H8U029_9HELO|nr:putative feruloyl esterase [Lachnellula hyalina]TVY26950.1 putative feruloyl esterase [Lachnellula hyalina]
MVKLSQFISAVALLSTPAFASQACTSFYNITVPGAEVLNITSVLQSNVSTPAFPPGPTESGLSFCDVTVVLTHPGENDTVTTEVWLPIVGWNGRFQATGGGGFLSGIGSAELGPAIAEGYVAASTDGGNIGLGIGINPAAFNSDGPIPGILADYIYRSVHDMAIIGKAVTKSYYGKAPNYSYWNGCSTGGRQGLQAAQAYPDDFDGIMAACPAINLAEAIIAIEWPYIVMNNDKTAPSQCVFNAFLNASIAQCDGLDGVKDGLISNVTGCDFDPYELVGTQVQCDGTTVTISEAVATVYRKILDGPKTSSGDSLWPGLNVGVRTDDLYPGDAHTVTTNGTTIAVPFPVGDEWVTYFIKHNSSFDTHSITYADVADLFAENVKSYGNDSSNDPNLSPFQKAGGKMIVWHGLADNLIPPTGTLRYRQKVEELLGGTDAVNDFWRLFFVPGVSHCGGGYGPVPTDPLAAVVAWVENGTAPNTLPAQYVDTSGATVNHDICKYPLVSRYDGKGDPKVASSYTRADSFGPAS